MIERERLTALLREAHGALERTRSRVRELEQAQQQARAPVAIVGLGCRYPGAGTPEQLWTMLEEGRSAITPWPAGRGGFDDGPPGAYLDDIDGFDADFFELDEGEAAHVDPRQRLLLEVAWEAIERAGLTRLQLRDARVGVYIGALSGDYAELRRDQPPHFHSLMGAVASALSARIAYFLGLRGPCLSLDAACASSLVSLHLASRALRAGECELALAGGVNVILDPRTSSFMDAMGIVSRTGRCRPFDAEADGFVRGEGCGVALLERLDDAQRLGHPILAVLRGSAFNHNGRSSGIMAPRSMAQIELVRTALGDASVTPSSVAFVEAQGIGNPHGDAVEAEALAEAYEAGAREREAPLWLTASKSSLGHTEGASGIAALIKTVMALRSGRLPALSLGRPSARVDWDRLGIRPARAARLEGPRPLRAGVHSYALTGVNAHLVVEAPAGRAPAEDSRTTSLPLPLLVSAPRASALAAQIERLACWLESPDHVSSPSRVDLVHSLATTRTHHRWRLGIRVAPASDARVLARSLRQRMLELDPDSMIDSRALLDGPSELAVWIGAPKPHVAARIDQLYAEHSGFRARLDEVCARLDPHCLDALLGEPTKAPAELSEQLEFALAWSLVRSMADWGPRPELLVAREGGELAAACLAGCASLELAARLLRVPSLARAEVLAEGGHSTAAAPSGASRLLLWRGGRLLAVDQLSLTSLLADEPAPESARVSPSVLERVGLSLDIGGPDESLPPSGGPRLALARPDTSIPSAVMEALTRAHERGFEVDWAALLGPLGGRRIELPTYAFERRSHWIERHPAATPRAPEAPADLTREQLEQLVREGFGAALRCEPEQLDMDASSIGSGLDSIMAVKLRNAFEQRTNLRLPAALVLELSTPRAVVDELWERLRTRGVESEAVVETSTPMSASSTSSAAQRTFAAQAEWLPGAYQNLYAFELRGPLRSSDVSAALRATASIDLGLRTTVVEGRVWLRDEPDPKITAEVDDVIALPRDELDPFLHSAVERVLDLELAPVWWQLVRISDEPDTRVLLMWLHHIAFDGTSISRLMRTMQQQLVLHAVGLADAPAPSPPALELPAREAAYLRSARAREDRIYWRKLCAQLPAPPSADPRVPLLNAPLATVGDVEHLEQVARARGQTPNGLLLWAFGRAVLEQLDLPAVGVGVTVDLRPIYRTDDASPCAINVVPVPIARGASPEDVLAASVESLRHARLPSSELGSMLDARASAPRFPMAVMFNSYVELMRGRERDGLPPGLPLSVRKLSTTHLPVIRPYVLSGFVSPAGRELRFHARYHPRSFTPSMIGELTERLRAYIDSPHE